MKVICYTSSTLRKRKNKKAKKRKACSTFSSPERKGKGRKLCLPTSNFCLRFFTVYRNTQRINLHPEARYEFRPAILFFRAKRGIRGCFVVKNSVLKCIWTICEEWVFRPKQDMDPNQSLYFFRVRLGYRGRFWMFNHWLDCIQTYVQEGLYIQKRDMCPDQPKKHFNKIK